MKKFLWMAVVALALGTVVTSCTTGKAHCQAHKTSNHR